MRKRAFAGVLSAALIISCAGPTAPRAEFTVTVSAAESRIHVSNRGSFSIGYFPIEQGALALSLWAPCGPEIPGCLILAPGADASLSYSAVTGYYSGAKAAVVYWWRLVPGPADGLVPDSIRAVTVTF